MKLPLASALCLSLLVAAAGSACSDRTPEVHVIAPVSLSGDRIQVRGQGGALAEIGPDGALSIDGRAVALAPAQLDASRRYYVQAMGMTQDGIAVGKAGAALAGKAVGNVISGLTQGDTESIERKVEADAKEVERQALRLCERMASLRAAQDELAGALPAFQPFAVVDADSVDDCKK
ncbi:DUF2884 domain-containing protein [Lysobacter firmicutimachus]|uniref:DUF2884 domain-containing protein n=1 Tax=Lysobacter firmicutimachus TaxID=1792846 RepID=A0AAU8MPD5_9GAMM